MTTTINTLDALRNLGVGEQVTVGTGSGQAWVKTEGGLTREDFTLNLEMFEGEVRAGRVSLGVRPQPGQVWNEAGGYFYVVIGQVVGSPTQWHCSRHNADGTFRRYTILENLPGRVQTGVSWAGMAFAMGQQWLAQNTDVKTYRDAYEKANEDVRRLTMEARERATRELREYRAALQSDLLVVASEQDWSYSSTFGNLMAKHGMDRPPKKRVKSMLTITVNGVSRLNIPAETVASVEGLPKGVEPQAANSTIVRWTKTLKHEHEHDEGEHTCNILRRSEVRAMLVAEGGDEFEGVTFDHTASCEVCNNPF